jgi:hypothetical protein
MPNGFFMFFNPPVWGWYLSSTVILLIISWNLHNVISWLKNKPFLSKRYNAIYIGTIVLVQPYWVLEIYANFTYFNPPYTRLFSSSRPLEALCRFVTYLTASTTSMLMTETVIHGGYLRPSIYSGTSSTATSLNTWNSFASRLDSQSCY